MRAKLTEDAIHAIRASRESGNVLGRQHGVSRTTIALIRRRIAWSHVQETPQEEETRKTLHAPVTLADRLLPHIAVSALDDFDVCWPWTAGRHSSGYATLRTAPQGPKAYVHRLMWELTWGTPVPDGKYVLHACDNRICCRPSHLWLGTLRDNALDREAKGRGRQPIGEDHRRSKLKNAQVLEIRASKRSEDDLAAHYGVSPSVIGAVRRRITWRHLP
jgi:hypothetical protein